MKVIIGSDHAGFRLKERIRRFLDRKGIKYEDVGAYSVKSQDDYPDFAVKVAKKVVMNKKNKGILICGTGTGMVMAANKVKGVRAAVGHDVYSAKMARHDNDANVLTLRARFFSYDKAIRIVSVWLKTPFSGLVRHKRRVNKVNRIK